jgi:hypothetical protein
MKAKCRRRSGQSAAFQAAALTVPIGPTLQKIRFRYSLTAPHAGQLISNFLVELGFTDEIDNLLFSKAESSIERPFDLLTGVCN